MGKIIIKVSGVLIMLFGLLMVLANSLQAVRAFQLFPYLCYISFGALLLNYESLLGYSSKVPGEGKRIHALALLSLVLGLVGTFGIWIFSLVAFMCGIVFLIMNRCNGNALRGNSVAVTGIIISSIWLFFFSVTLFYDPQKHWDLADTYLNEGKYDQAIMEYDKTIKEEPRALDAYFQRAVAYAGKGDYDNAIADYTKRIELDPSTHPGDPYFDRKFAAVILERSKIYFHEKEYEKAWEDVHKAESLGGMIDSEFIEDLRRTSGRDK